MTLFNNLDFWLEVIVLLKQASFVYSFLCVHEDELNTFFSSY